jgi:DNA polymerase
VICTLGNFATKLLRGDPAGITRVHGEPEVRTFGTHTARIYPLFHPAAALYTPSTLETLREDFARLPAVLALPMPTPAPIVAGVAAQPVAEAIAEPTRVAAAEAEQLGLF